MQIDFYNNFYKKDNSTLRPTVGGAGNLTEVHTVTGILKEPCSILNPVVSLQDTPVQSSIPAVCTYAYIPHFFRYYWVKDWKWENGLWVAYLAVDVLASWKTHIGEQSEYILRTDSTVNFNGEISDVTYPTTTDIKTISTQYIGPFTPASLSSGCYVVGIISGGSNSAIGAISYYAMTDTEFETLKGTLFSDNNLVIMDIITSGGQQLVQDLSQEVLKTLYNPYQYIASCMWFPISIADLISHNIVPSTYVTQINIGWWAYPLTGYEITYPMMNLDETDIALPDHPQSSTRGIYLNYAPYTFRTLHGRYGTIPLDTAFFKSGDTITIKYNVDLVTGNCRAIVYRIRGNNTDFVIERLFMLGVPIQIAQVGTDYLGTAVSAINTVPALMAGAIGGVASGIGAVGGALIAGASGIYNTIQSVMPQLETQGANGSFLSSNINTKMVTMFYTIVDEDIGHRGRPLCEIRRIDTLSGFILCAEGDLDLDVYDEERKQIKSFLTTGFFWE